ncbi:MAG: hypothetical protein Q9166_006362 [cf. Caloplaca sp. 2 TL-2023]
MVFLARLNSLDDRNCPLLKRDSFHAMAEIAIYEEIPRPYLPPPELDWANFRVKSRTYQVRIEKEIYDMLELFRLVLEPLEDQMRTLRRDQNMNDLLQKLKWFAILFQKIKKHPCVTPVVDRLSMFEAQVDKLLKKQDIHMDTNPETGGMPATPITDLVMGVCFDARPWTSAEVKPKPSDVPIGAPVIAWAVTSHGDRRQ